MKTSENSGNPKTMNSATRLHDLKTLILSFHSVIAVETVEEDRVESLLRTLAGELQMPLYEWTITKGLIRYPDLFVVQGTNDPQSLLETLEKFKVEGIFWLKDFEKNLKDSALLRQFREVGHKFVRDRSTIILTGASVNLPREITSMVVYYDLRLPSVQEFYQVYRAVVQSLRQTHRIQVQMSDRDTGEFLKALSGMTLTQARQTIAYAALLDGKLDPSDIQWVLERKAQMIRQGGLLDYFPEENNLRQLGGFTKLKLWLQEAKVGFTRQARSLNLSPPKGLLLVGIQGCGKSLAAKAITREWKLPLLKLDASKLYDKYMGESEKNFSRAICLAESIAPVVLWIDEIEKGFSMTGGGDADGGLSRRLFGTFLTWLQEKRQEIFVVATANDIAQLPPELLRKGRFDEIFFVDLPNEEERAEIFKIHLCLHKQNPEHFELAKLVAVSAGFGGAEIEQTVIASLYLALHLQRPLDTSLLLEEIRATVPLSVSRREDVERLRNFARDRFVSVR
jgi:ATP-dependent 26S proteasome regulatory subunit